VCPKGHSLFLTPGYSVGATFNFVISVSLRLSRCELGMGAEEKIALDLALVVLIIVLVWARWRR